MLRLRVQKKKLIQLGCIFLQADNVYIKKLLDVGNLNQNLWKYETNTQFHVSERSQYIPVTFYASFLHVPTRYWLPSLGQ